MGPDFGPGFGPHIHHGPHFPMTAFDLWPAMSGLLATLGVVLLAWSCGVMLLMSHALRAPRRAERVDTRLLWRDALDRHQAVAQAYAAFECDARAVLATPGLADVRQAPTARFVDAFAEAGALATERYPAEVFAQRFIDAVEREERAWAAAVAAAERMRDSRFTPQERDLFEQARHLLEIVATSEFDEERHSALGTLQRKLRELERRTGWHVPRQATLALEARARGALVA